MSIIESRNALIALSAFVVCFAGILSPASHAQTQEQTVPVQNIVKVVSPDPSPGYSFLGGLLPDMREPIGFSVGVSRVYAPDPGSHAVPDQFTSINPRLFTQVKAKGLRFQLDYAFGFRWYDRQSSLTSYDHSASVFVSKNVSRNLSLSVSNQFRMGFNDSTFSPTSLLFSGTALRDLTGFAQDIYVHRQKETRSSTAVNADYHLSRRGALGVFGSYDYLRYEKDVLGSQSVSLGVRTGYQIRSWVSFDTTYSTYLTTIDKRFRTSSIDRLQFAGFRYKLGPQLEAFTTGGLEYARFLGSKRATAGFETGIYRTGKSNQISVIYHRGLSNALGGGTVLGGHSVNASFVQTLSRRMSLTVSSTYTSGALSFQSSSLKTMSASGSLGIALMSHMFFAANYSYISQRANNLSFNSINLNRYVVSAGLHYSLPDLLGRRYPGR